MKQFLLLLSSICLVNAGFINWNDLDFLDSPESNLEEVNDVPPHDQLARVARYIVHKSDWVSFGTISTLKSISGYPMVNIISVADSARNASSTGKIYFYLTNLDFTAQDLEKKNKATLMFTNDVDLECSKTGMDPMEPTCGRLFISGYVVRVKNNTDDFEFGYKSFLSRHPGLVRWNAKHDFFLCRLEIEQIIVLDFYGGGQYVKPADYYAVKDTEVVSSGQLADKEKLSTNNGQQLHIKVHSDVKLNDINIEIV